MSHAGGYCPNCEQYVSPPLLPLDYYQCNNCMMSVHVDDLIKKRNMLLAGAQPNPFGVSVVGRTLMYDPLQVTDTVIVPCSTRANDTLFVVTSTNGANQHPNSVTCAGVSFTEITSFGATTGARTSVWYGVVPATGPVSVSVYWTGQHPFAAIATVISVTGLENNPVLDFNGNYGTASTTGAGAGGSVSPTRANSYAIYAVTLSDMDYFTNKQPEWTILSRDNTSENGAPGDCSQLIMGEDIPQSKTVSTVTTMATPIGYSQAIVILGKR